MDRDQRRQCQEFAFVVLHIVIIQPVRVVPIRSLDLRDDLVAAAIKGEAVNLRFAEQCRQRAAQIQHGHAHLRRLGPIDIDYHLGLVEGQINIEKGKLA